MRARIANFILLAAAKLAKWLDPDNVEITITYPNSEIQKWGECRGCHKKFRIKKDGTLYGHLRTGMLCRGSGMPPV